MSSISLIDQLAPPLGCWLDRLQTTCHRIAVGLVQASSQSKVLVRTSPWRGLHKPGFPGTPAPTWETMSALHCMLNDVVNAAL